MKLNVHGETNVGMKRTSNEDSFYINEEKNLFIVADGMGGAAAGEEASKMVCEKIPEEVLSSKGDMPYDMVLEKAIESANTLIFEKASKEPALSGMGSTVVLLFIVRDAAYLAHAGDSRIYLVRNEDIERVTEDHSIIQEQIKLGGLTEEEAKGFPFKNVITRAIGVKETVKPDVTRKIIYPGDCFLLCTDGLTNLLRDRELRDIILNAEGNLKEAAKNLITLANGRGGDDNITVILVEAKEDVSH